MSEIGRHFNQPDHGGLEDVEIHILDFIHSHLASSKAKYLRDLVEYNWIQRLHTGAPAGLNLMDRVKGSRKESEDALASSIFFSVISIIPK